MLKARANESFLSCTLRRHYNEWYAEEWMMDAGYDSCHRDNIEWVRCTSTVHAVHSWFRASWGYTHTSWVSQQKVSRVASVKQFQTHLAPLHRPNAIRANPPVINTRCATDECPTTQSAYEVASAAVKSASGSMRYPESPVLFQKAQHVPLFQSNYGMLDVRWYFHKAFALPSPPRRRIPGS